MPKTAPKTHSEILWHFTGGPKWDSRRNIQLKSRKSESQAYEVLKAILQSQTLRLGGYHEVMKVLVGEERYYDIEAKEIRTRKNQLKEVATSRVCCVADIPITELGFHSKRYGRIAIGFHRAALMRANFNPVLYTPDESFIVQNFYSAQKSLGNIDASNIESEIDNLLSEAESQFQEISSEASLDLDGSSIELEAEMLVSDAEEALAKMEDSLAFIKTFRKKDFEEIYAEREWRSAKEFNFRPSDVAMILLPCSGSTNLFKKFVEKDRKSFRVASSISVKKWEDEVE